MRSFTTKSTNNKITNSDFVDRIKTQVAFHGLTGRIQFKEGSRSNIKWDLLKLRQTELDKVGEWTNTGGLNVTKPEAFHEFGDTNITLKVTTIEVSTLLSIYSSSSFSNFTLDL